VGIGTSSPATTLDVNGAIRAQGATISASGEGLELIYTGSTPWHTGNQGLVQSYNRGSSTFSPVGFNGSFLSFATASTERMRVTSAGNVAIGDTVADWKLTVTNIGAASSIAARSNGNVAMIMAVDTSGAGYLTTNNAQPMLFSTNNTERMRINSAGNVGIGTTSPGYKLEVNGSFAATTKSFVINHPTKPDMRLRYGSLEGPENGVYVRGRTKGDTIQLPDYWTGLVDEFSITVNLTPIGSHQKLYVKNIDKNVVTIGGGLFDQMEYFYTVFAERKDVDKLIVEI
jgi:hypothetical protein